MTPISFYDNVKYLELKGMIVIRDLIIRQNHEIADKVYNSNTITKNMLQSLSRKKENIAAILSELASGIQSVNEIIQPEKLYVAKFPKDILDKMNSGQYEIMKSKTGDLLANIIDTTAPKNKNIVHNIRLNEIDPSATQKLHNLTMNVANIAIQTQLAQISEMLSKIQTLAIEIKRGQIIDRIGFINSGREQLEQAILLPEDSKTREHLIYGAIKSLNDGRSQLEIFLSEKIKNSVEIPQNRLLLNFRCFFNSNLYYEAESAFYEFQEGFHSFVDATNLLASAYEHAGSLEALPRVFQPAKKLIKTSHVKMSQLSNLVLNGDAILDNEWFKSPDDLINNIESYSNQALLDDVEYVSIEVPGKMLLTEGCKYE